LAKKILPDSDLFQMLLGQRKDSKNHYGTVFTSTASINIDKIPTKLSTSEYMLMKIVFSKGNTNHSVLMETQN
jgi:hypothetical protein